MAGSGVYRRGAFSVDDQVVAEAAVDDVVTGAAMDQVVAAAAADRRISAERPQLVGPPPAHHRLARSQTDDEVEAVRDAEGVAPAVGSDAFDRIPLLGPCAALARESGS
jgi:hypothetical protein